MLSDFSEPDVLAKKFKSALPGGSGLEGLEKVLFNSWAPLYNHAIKKASKGNKSHKWRGNLSEKVEAMWNENVKAMDAFGIW